MSISFKHKLFVAALAVWATTLAAPRPVKAVDLTFGLLGHHVVGTCSVVTTTYIAVMDSHQKPHVFVFKPNYHPPQGVGPGRRVKVSYGKRSDGLLEVKKIDLLKP